MWKTYGQGISTAPLYCSPVRYVLKVPPSRLEKVKRAGELSKGSNIMPFTSLFGQSQKAFY